MKLTLKERLECPASFADDDSPHLLCSYDGCCDGNLYECCCIENEELAFRAMREDEE